MTERPTDNNNNKVDVDKANETKNLVKKLFQKIKDNQLIPDSAQEHLQNLYNPYIKIALQTPNLFAFENHQSRMFLESACRISIDWIEVEDKGDAYIKKLVNIIERIAAQDRYDNRAFIGFQAELEKSLVKLRKRSAILQKRELEKQRGQQKIAKAKLNTDKLITEKLSEFNKIPEFIQQILINEWTNVLVLLHIRNGSESEIYRSKLQFVDLLLDLSQLQKQILKKSYEILLSKYQKGLHLVAFNKQEIVQKQKQLLHFLQQRHQQIEVAKSISPEDILKISQHQISEKNLSAKEHSKSADDAPTAVVYKSASEEAESINLIKSVNEIKQSKPLEQELQEPKDSKESIQDSTDDNKAIDSVDFTDIVTRLETGSWFEILGDNGKAIKAKLSWISPISGKHLFVDTQGLKISDKSTSELIEGLTDKTISVITKV